MKRGMQANNTSGLVGIGLGWKRERNGQRHRVVRVSWCLEGKPRRTSISLVHGPVAAVTAAMALRERTVGDTYDITPRQAWNRLKAAHA